MQPQPIPTGNNKFRIPLIVAFVAGSILIIVLAVGIFTRSHDAPKVSQFETEFDNSSFSREAIVNITKDGFVPSTVTISPNTRLNWENKDASTHNLTLNDANQKDGPATSSRNDPQLPTGVAIVAGGGVAHVFEQRGTYIFHDQANPTANVTVEVK